MSSQSWLDSFKLALIEEDFEKIDQLNLDLPQFDTVKQMQEAQAYIKQAATILLQKQKKLKKNMSDVLKTKKYLDS